MDDATLADLYFRTTLELADREGMVWRVTPTEAEPDNPATLLSPYTDAFILTAENPESRDENTAEDNARATASLRSELEKRGVMFRDCPGYGFDTDHIERGFAILADQTTHEQIRHTALELATRYRQNAIFHLNAGGLGLIGALRVDMTGLRPVRIERA